MHSARVILTAVLAIVAAIAAHAPLGDDALRMYPHGASVPLLLALLAQAALLTLSTGLEHSRARALGLHLLGPALVVMASLAAAAFELTRLDEALGLIDLVDGDRLFFAGARAALAPMVVGLAGAGLGLGVAAFSGAFAALIHGTDRGGRGFGGGLLFIFAAGAGGFAVGSARAAVELRRGYALASRGLDDASASYASAEGALAAGPLVLIGAIALGAALLTWRSKQARFFRGARLVGLVSGVVLAAIVVVAPALWRELEGEVHARHAIRVASVLAPSAPLVSGGSVPATSARARDASSLPRAGRVDLELKADAPSGELLALARLAAKRGLRTHLVARRARPASFQTRLGHPRSPPLPVALAFVIASDDPDGAHEDERDASLGPGALLWPGRPPVSLEALELERGTTLNLFLDPRSRARDLARVLEAAETAEVRVRLTATAR